MSMRSLHSALMLISDRYSHWHQRPEHQFWHWFITLATAVFSFLIITWPYDVVVVDTTLTLRPHLAHAAALDLTVNSSPGDGTLDNYQAGVPWSTVRDATTGTSALATTATRDINVSSWAAGGNYEIRRGLFLFDTTTIPVNATLTGATLKLFVTGKNNTSNDGNDWFVLVPATPATIPPTTADFSRVDSTELSTRLATPATATGAYATFTLNAAGLAAIVEGGLTTLALREGHDLLNIPIAPLTSDKITIAFSEAGTTQAPVLDVDYTT